MGTNGLRIASFFTRAGPSASSSDPVIRAIDFIQGSNVILSTMTNVTAIFVVSWKAWKVPSISLASVIIVLTDDAIKRINSLQEIPSVHYKLEPPQGLCPRRLRKTRTPTDATYRVWFLVLHVRSEWCPSLRLFLLSST